MKRYGHGSRVYFWLLLAGDFLALAVVVWIGVALLLQAGVIPHGAAWPSP